MLFPLVHDRTWGNAREASTDLNVLRADVEAGRLVRLFPKARLPPVFLQATWPGRMERWGISEITVMGRASSSARNITMGPG